MKKTKKPGDNFSLKTKKTENPLVMQWINTQTNLMDSVRYLMEKEIFQNGVRNLQACIPAERNVLQGESVLPPEILYTSQASGQEESASAAESDEDAVMEIGTPHGAEPAAEEEIDDEDIEAWI